MLAVCLPLRLDGALSYLAANNSVTPVAPLLWFSAIQIGARVLLGHWVPLSVAGAHALIVHPGPLIGALCLGSVLLGGSFALAGGVVTYFVAERRSHREPSAFDLAVARTAERYARAAKSRGTYYYVKGKLRGDPSTQAVAGLAPLGDVLDLGCGRGQLAVLLLEFSAAERVRGCDWDQDKVAVANGAVEGLGGEFAQGDVRSADVERADTVLLIDVLHYFDRATQDALLTRAAGLVKPGGRLMLREADTGRGWRSLMTRIEEGFFTAIKFNRGERVLFRDVAGELAPLLEAQGLSCTIVPCWGGTPFSNVLLVATRPNSA